MFSGRNEATERALGLVKSSQGVRRRRREKREEEDVVVVLEGRREDRK